MPSFVQPQLDDLRTRWYFIEGKLKEMEFLGDKPAMPAVNALRYAGRQMAELIDLGRIENPTQTQQEAIVSAVAIAHDSMNIAQSDVVDAALYVLDQDTRAMRDRYHDTLLMKHVPGFQDLLSRLAVCANLIIETRENPAVRRGHYQIILDKHFKQMLDIYRDGLPLIAIPGIKLESGR